MPAMYILVKGKVQGVFFRATAKEEADKIGVTGKVRNTEDGDVEIWASGSEAQLQQYLDWCRKGPARARVTEVLTKKLEGGDYNGFEVIRS